MEGLLRDHSARLRKLESRRNRSVIIGDWTLSDQGGRLLAIHVSGVTVVLADSTETEPESGGA